MQNRNKKISVLVVILTILVGVVWTVYSSSQSKNIQLAPPELPFESGFQGFLNKKGFIKYSASDVDPTATCANPVTLKAGTHVYYSTTPLTMETWFKKVKPVEGNQLRIYYYSVGEGGISNKYYVYPERNYSQATHTEDLSDQEIKDFTIPAYRGVIFLNKKETQFCDAAGTIKTETDYIDNISLLNLSPSKSYYLIPTTQDAKAFIDSTISGKIAAMYYLYADGPKKFKDDLAVDLMNPTTPGNAYSIAWVIVDANEQQTGGDEDNGDSGNPDGEDNKDEKLPDEGDQETPTIDPDTQKKIDDSKPAEEKPLDALPVIEINNKVYDTEVDVQTGENGKYMEFQLKAEKQVGISNINITRFGAFGSAEDYEKISLFKDDKLIGESTFFGDNKTTGFFFNGEGEAGKIFLPKDKEVNFKVKVDVSPCAEIGSTDFLYINLNDSSISKEVEFKSVQNEGNGVIAGSTVTIEGEKETCEKSKLDENNIATEANAIEEKADPMVITELSQSNMGYTAPGQQNVILKRFTVASKEDAKINKITLHTDNKNIDYFDDMHLSVTEYSENVKEVIETENVTVNIGGNTDKIEFNLNDLDINGFKTKTFTISADIEKEFDSKTEVTDDIWFKIEDIEFSSDKVGEIIFETNSGGPDNPKMNLEKKTIVTPHVMLMLIPDEGTYATTTGKEIPPGEDAEFATIQINNLSPTSITIDEITVDSLYTKNNLGTIKDLEEIAVVSSTGAQGSWTDSNTAVIESKSPGTQKQTKLELSEVEDKSLITIPANSYITIKILGKYIKEDKDGNPKHGNQIRLGIAYDGLKFEEKVSIDVLPQQVDYATPENWGSLPMYGTVRKVNKASVKKVCVLYDVVWDYCIIKED